MTGAINRFIDKFKTGDTEIHILPYKPKLKQKDDNTKGNAICVACM